MNDNNISGIIFLAFTVFGFVVVLNSEIEMEAKMFPSIILSLLAIGSIVLIIKGFKKENSEKPKINWKKVFPIALLLIIYAYLLEFTGYIYSTLGFLLILLLFLGIRQPLKLLGVAVITTFGVYWIFESLLKVQLP